MNSDEDSKNSNDTKSNNGGWEFEEASVDSKSPVESENHQRKNQMKEKSNDITSVSSSIPESSGLTKETNVVEAAVLEFPAKISQENNSPVTTTQPILSDDGYDQDSTT